MSAPASFRDDILDRISERLDGFPEVRKSKIFGHPGFSINDRVFAFLYEDGLTLKLHPDDYSTILKLKDAEPFKPRGSAMGTWAVLTYPEAEDYLENWIWIEKAMSYIITPEAAPPKKKHKGI